MDVKHFLIGFFPNIIIVRISKKPPPNPTCARFHQMNNLMYFLDFDIAQENVGGSQTVHYPVAGDKDHIPLNNPLPNVLSFFHVLNQAVMSPIRTATIKQEEPDIGSLDIQDPPLPPVEPVLVAPVPIMTIKEEDPDIGTLSEQDVPGSSGIPDAPFPPVKAMSAAPIPTTTANEGEPDIGTSAIQDQSLIRVQPEPVASFPATMIKQEVTDIGTVDIRDPTFPPVEEPEPAVPIITTARIQQDDPDVRAPGVQNVSLSLVQDEPVVSVIPPAAIKEEPGVGSPGVQASPLPSVVQRPLFPVSTVLRKQGVSSRSVVLSKRKRITQLAGAAVGAVDVSSQQRVESAGSSRSFNNSLTTSTANSNRMRSANIGGSPYVLAGNESRTRKHPTEKAEQAEGGLERWVVKDNSNLENTPSTSKNNSLSKADFARSQNVVNGHGNRLSKRTIDAVGTPEIAGTEEPSRQKRRSCGAKTNLESTCRSEHNSLNVHGANSQRARYAVTVHGKINSNVENSQSTSKDNSISISKANFGNKPVFIEQRNNSSQRSVDPALLDGTDEDEIEVVKKEVPETSGWEQNPQQRYGHRVDCSDHSSYSRFTDNSISTTGNSAIDETQNEDLKEEIREKNGGGKRWGYKVDFTDHSSYSRSTDCTTVGMHGVIFEGGHRVVVENGNNLGQNQRIVVSPEERKASRTSELSGQKRWGVNSKVVTTRISPPGNSINMHNVNFKEPPFVVVEPGNVNSIVENTQSTSTGFCTNLPRADYTSVLNNVVINPGDKARQILIAPMKQRPAAAPLPQNSLEKKTTLCSSFQRDQGDPFPPSNEEVPILEVPFLGVRERNKKAVKTHRMKLTEYLDTAPKLIKNMTEFSEYLEENIREIEKHIDVLWQLVEKYELQNGERLILVLRRAGIF